MKARPLQAIKVYVFLHELQPPCQQLIPWVTRSKPLYSLAFGKDNTHLLRCKGLFLPGSAPLVCCRCTSPTRKGGLSCNSGGSPPLRSGLMPRWQCRDSLTEHYLLPRAVKISSSSERFGWVPRLFRYSLIIASKT